MKKIEITFREEVSTIKTKIISVPNGFKFKELGDKLQAESVKLVAATKTGKEDAFKAAFTATGGTCKSCHDDFKNK